MSLFLKNYFLILLGFVACIFLLVPAIGFHEFWLTKWFLDINWATQSVANGGAWAAGIGSSIAALFTAWAAHSTARAAKAAQESAEQWKQQSIFDIYYTKSAETRVRLDEAKRVLYHLALIRFKPDVNINMTSKEAALRLHGVGVWSKPDVFARQTIQLQQACKDWIKICPSTVRHLAEAFLLSKEHVELKQSEKEKLGNILGEFKTNMHVLESTCKRLNNLKGNPNATQFDLAAYLALEDDTQYNLVTLVAQLELFTYYLDFIVIEQNNRSWEQGKRRYIKHLQDRFVKNDIFSHLPDNERNSLVAKLLANTEEMFN